MKKKRLLAALLACSVAGAGLPTARADDASTQAFVHFQEGVTFYREGDFAAALVEFKRAYELAPHWQGLLNIGQSYFQLKDYANALVTLQRYLGEGGDAITPDNRATAEGEVADLKNRVGRLQITSNVDGATVSVDDVVVGKTPLADPVLASAGQRKVTASIDGRASVSVSVSVTGNEQIPVSLQFAPAVPATPPASTTSPPPPVPTTTATTATTSAPPATPTPAASYDKRPMYIAAGVGAVGVVFGSIFGVAALSNKSTLDKDCASDKSCPLSSQGTIDTASRNATLSTIGYAVGVIGLGTAAVLWLTAPPAKTEPAKNGARVTPWIGLGSAGLSGSF
jgi:hypothetical protein